MVPWDIPGHFPNTPQLTVPTWVSQDDALPHVTFTQPAERALAQSVRYNQLAPLYAPDVIDRNNTNKNDKNGIDDTDDNCAAFRCAKEAIREVLAQDPRAVTRRGTVEGANSKAGHGTRAVTPYRMVFGDVRLEFVVVEGGTVEVVGVGKVGDGGGGVDGVPFSEDGTMAV